MSDSLTFLFPEEPPQPREVQAELERLDFPLVLGTEKQSFEDAFGFWPMKLQLGGVDIDLGLEIYSESPAAFLSSRGLRADPRFQRGLSFRWGGGGPPTLFCIDALCTALVRTANCAVYDEYHEGRLSEEDLKLFHDSASDTYKKVRQFYVVERDEWISQFLSLLRRRNAAYEVNPLAAWPNAEIYLERDNVFEQHSTITQMPVLGPHDFAHCFAVSAHLSDTSSSALGPFTIGERCNGGCTIMQAFERDLGATVRGPDRVRGLQSRHSRRKGFEEIVMACTSNAEEHLAPVYRRQLSIAAPTLLKSIELVENAPTLLQDEVRREHYEKRLGTNFIGAGTVAAPNEPLKKLGGTLPEAIACLNHQYLTKYRSDLPEVAKRLEKLIPSA